MVKYYSDITLFSGTTLILFVKEQDITTYVVYECDHILADGTCDPNSLTISIRQDGSTAPLTHEQLMKLRPTIQRMCLDVTDFTPMESKGMEACCLLGYIQYTLVKPNTGRQVVYIRIADTSDYHLGGGRKWAIKQVFYHV